MKAIVIKQFGGYDKLIVENVETPKLKMGEVLVKMKFTPVNYLDTLIRSGDESIPKEFCLHCHIF